MWVLIMLPPRLLLLRAERHAAPPPPTAEPSPPPPARSLPSTALSRACPQLPRFFLSGSITMNATTIPVPELIGQLLDAADGILADAAAAGLIISHQTFPHRDAFRRIISTGASISTGQPLATIGWDAALRALDAGQMPCASSGRPSCGSPPASAIPPPASGCAPSRATWMPVTSSWSPAPSPPPTANPSQLPERPGPQIGCRIRAGLEPICRPLRIPLSLLTS